MIEISVVDFYSTLSLKKNWNFGECSCHFWDILFVQDDFWYVIQVYFLCKLENK